MDGARLIRRLAAGAAGAVALVVARPRAAHSPSVADRNPRTGRDGDAAAEDAKADEPTSGNPM